LIIINIKIQKMTKGEALKKFFNRILVGETRTYNDYGWYVCEGSLSKCYRSYIEGSSRYNKRFPLLPNDLDTYSLRYIMEAQSKPKNSSSGKLYGVGRYAIIRNHHPSSHGYEDDYVEWWCRACDKIDHNDHPENYSTSPKENRHQSSLSSSRRNRKRKNFTELMLTNVWLEISIEVRTGETVNFSSRFFVPHKRAGKLLVIDI